MRTSSSVVTFAHPFDLPGIPWQLAAGDYQVTTEEESLPGLTFSAYRLVAAYLTIHSVDGYPSRTEMRPINLEDLERAQQRDRTLSGTDAETRDQPAQHDTTAKG